MKYDVVIVASGKGVRANLGYNKAFYIMNNNRSVLENAANLFVEDDDCVNIIVVTNKEYFNDVFNNDKLILVEGGIERRDSVFNGLEKVKSDYVLIHDAARPFLHKESLEDIKRAVVEKNAVILAKKATDTIKYVNNGFIEKTIDRNCVYMAETPQAFKTSLIKQCYDKCEHLNFTDDALLAEELGYKVYIVEDKYDNRKLTSQEDFKNL